MAGYQVLYRKYRPKNFSEVVGQGHVVQTLLNALVLGRVGHAYLFAGPRGTGKTTVARILARAVNCVAENKESGSKNKAEPCNKCQICVEMSEGRALDLIEIDAASHRGIDEVRALRESTRFTPSHARYKVFIIDEVHQLTKEAFNALLKTLEEPPEHVLFIFATTEPYKIPQTVLSRVQRFDFRRITHEEIVKRLKKVMKAEGVKVDDDALALIAQQAEGSIRDAESLLEQVLILQDEHITKEEVGQILGLVDRSTFQTFLEYIGAADAAEALALVNNAVEQGVDMGQFMKMLVEYTRDLLVLAVEPKLAEFLAQRMGKEYARALTEQARHFSPHTLQRVLDQLLLAQERMRYSPLPQLPLELAVVEITSEADKQRGKQGE